MHKVKEERGAEEAATVVAEEARQTQRDPRPVQPPCAEQAGDLSPELNEPENPASLQPDGTADGEKLSSGTDAAAPL